MIKLLGSTLMAAAFLLPTGLAAQVSRLSPSSETKVGLEVSKTFMGDLGFGWYTSVVRGRLLTPVGTKTHLMIDWGLSMASLSGTSSGTLSNPEIGLVFSNEAGASTGFFSVVLPIAKAFGDDDFATLTGFLSDIETPERFVPELWSINAGLTPSVPVGPRTTLDFVAVGSAKLPDGDGDPELFARYGLGISRDTDFLRLYAELTGLAILSEGDLSFGERSIHQVSVGIDGLTGGPGLFIRVPLDDAFDSVDATVGITFTF